MAPIAVLLAWRGVTRRPQIAGTMAVTMALSIGVAGTVFGLFDQVFLKALPFARPERLVRIATYDPAAPADLRDVSLPDYDDIRREVRSLQDLAAFTVFPSNLQVTSTTVPVRVAFATPELFPLLGAEPLLGRVFSTAENVLYGDVRKAVLSHALWRRLFAARPDVVGRSVVLRGETYEVIGVMPATFTYPERADLWAPMMARYSSFTDRWWELRSLTMHVVVGRLAPGTSSGQVDAELEVLMRDIRGRFKADVQNTHATAVDMRHGELRALRPYISAASIVALMVMAIGCLNIVNLLLAQAVARDREVALHAALGAGHGHLARRLIAEGAMVGAVGAVGGVLLAMGATRVLAALVPVRLPYWLTLTVDARVVAFAVLVAGVLSVILPLVGIRHHHGLRLGEIMRTGGSALSGDRGATRLRRWLLVTQVAVSMVVVSVASLIVQSVRRILAAESGMRSSQVVVARGSRYIPRLTLREESVRYGDEWLRIARRLEELPGVEAVSLADEIPFDSDRADRTSFRMYTRERSTPDRASVLPMAGAFIMPRYFATLGIPLLEGRDFSDLDRFDAPHVIIVSDRMARTLFPGRSAIGQEVKWGEDPEFTWATVIGVVGPSRWVAEERDAGHEFYYTQRQHPGAYPRFVVRTSADPGTLVEPVRRAIRDVSPEFGVEWVKPLEALRAEAIWHRTLAGWVVSAFGVLALLLSAFGVYGIASHMVSRRSREMSVRLALGSTPWALCRLVMRDASRVVLAGIAVGIGVALAGRGALVPVLWNTSPVEPGALLGAAALTLGVAIAGSLGPALRVLQIAPMRALREE